MRLRIGRFRLSKCTGHHWHITRRGWTCCHCKSRAGASAAPASVHIGPCAGLAVIDDLQSWVQDLARPSSEPVPGRRLVQRARMRVPV